tara:strand:+ start:7840 stop:8421 length:582 start_codon:yes stop_codon:yes gene_type:complete
MRLEGKRVERLNTFGDELCVDLRDSGLMKLSPALISRLGIKTGDNKVGFAYPDHGDKVQNVQIFKAVDGNGVAVNPQGVIKNMPHNRDLRSEYNLASTGQNKLFVSEDSIEYTEHEGYKFFKIQLQANVESVEAEASVSEWEDAAEPQQEVEVIKEVEEESSVVQGREFTPVEKVDSIVKPSDNESYDSTDIF